MSKVVEISDDSGSTFHAIPGGSADWSTDGDNVNDTILGQTYNSGLTGLLGWSVVAPGFYKGIPGYVADLKKQGTTTNVSAESFTVVTGKTFKIDDAAKEVWDRANTVVIKDDGTPVVAADIESLDYLFGTVTFTSSYTVVGAITGDLNYFPMATFGKAQSFTLTQTAAALETTDFPIAQANGGFKTHSAGLRTVTLELSEIFDAAADFQAEILARNELIIEVNPDGNGKSKARGFFRLMQAGQGGAVGDNEIETLNFSLNVPDADIVPFGWEHASDTTLPLSIEKLLDLWESQTDVDVRYLHDGTNGYEGTAVITDITLTSALAEMNEFSISFQGDGAQTDVP